MAEPNCPRCGQAISADDTLAFSANQIFHLNCQRTRDLSPEEGVLLFRYCRDRWVAKCVAGLRDHADVLMREAEVAMARLRETMAKVAATELRQTDRGFGSK